MTMRKKCSVSILVLLLMAALCVCLFACEEGIDGLPQSEEDLIGAAIGITINLHDVHGPNSGAVRTITAMETTSLSRSDFDAEYYECIGVYDAQGTLLYDFNEGWTVNVFDETFSSSFGNELNLWLRWQAEKIQLRFDAEDVDPMAIEYGASRQTLSVPDYEGTDYRFDGWLNNGALITDKNGNVLIESFDASRCTIRYGVVSLTPRLVKRTSTVVFTNALQDKNVSKTYDYGYALSASDYPRVEEPEHREFVGWSTSPLAYVPQTEPLHASSVSFYAIWKKYTTLTFLDGDRVFASKRVYEGEVLNLETYDGLNRDGYEVEGVYINQHFSGNAEVSYPYGEDRAFYVRWERVYDVTFYEGGNNPIGTRKVREGDKLIPHYYELIKGTSNEGHQVSGLYCSPTFEGAPVGSYSADQGVSSLYVKRNDGLASCIFYHSNYPKVASLEAAVKTSYANDGSASDWAGSHFRCRGWTFAGWATSGNGAVKYVNGQSIDEIAQDGVINLYAVWKVSPTEVGQYVPTCSVVSDTDGAATYTVYNTIDSTPWNLADYAIVDWRNESNTVVGKHTKRVVNDNRYNNIDICKNTKQVYFIGAPKKTYTDFHFHLVNYTSRDWLNIVFVNFRYETAADGALKTWWDSNHSDKNANLRLTLIGDNAIGSSRASGDLIYQMTHMIVDGSGTLVLRAGKGADASDAGAKGGVGGVAIRATLLEVALDATGKLTVYGGAGGAGAAGEDSNAQGSSGWTRSWVWQGGAGDGEQGGQGGTGGAGGDGGDAMIGTLFVQTGNCTIVGGKGGNGGKGGRGGKGGKGGNNTAWGGSTGNGGKGGKGGTGGNNGIGSHNVRLSFKCSDTAVLNVLPGSNGKVGAGGSGGYGGDPGSPNALCGGGGGYGATGDKGDPGIELNVYDYNGHHYLLVYDSLDWDEAKAYCEARGGHLATITSEEEDAFVQKLAPSGGCWVGATDRETEGTWKWITGETWSYTNWGSGEPNNANSGEDALEFHSSYWNDNNESGKKPFICEWDS